MPQFGRLHGVFCLHQHISAIRGIIPTSLVAETCHRTLTACSRSPLHPPPVVRPCSNPCSIFKSPLSSLNTNRNLAKMGRCVHPHDHRPSSRRVPLTHPVACTPKARACPPRPSLTAVPSPRGPRPPPRRSATRSSSSPVAVSPLPRSASSSVTRTAFPRSRA